MNPRDGTNHPRPDLGHMEKPRPRFNRISSFWGRFLGRSLVKTMVFGLLTPLGSGCPGFQAIWSHGDPDRVILDVFDQVLGLRQYQRCLAGALFFRKIDTPF